MQLPTNSLNRSFGPLVVAAGLFLASCGGGDAGPVSPPGGVDVARVDVTSPLNTLFVGDTVRLSAVARDAAGNPMPAQTISWSSNAHLVASVNGTGLVVGLAPGRAKFLAAAGGVSGATEFDVVAPPVGQVVISGLPDSVFVGATVKLEIVVTDVRGNPIHEPEAAWETLSPEVLGVDAQGKVEALAAGIGRVRVSVDGVSDEVQLRVVAQATLIGGIVSSNLTLKISGSPYEIDGVLEVAPGVTLRVEPGVVLRSGGIDLWGTFEAIGSLATPVRLEGVRLRPQTSWGSGSPTTHLERVVMLRSSVVGLGPFGGGWVRIKDSQFTDGSVGLRYMAGEISRNLFLRTRVYLSNGVAGVQVRNNTFVAWHQARSILYNDSALRSDGAEVVARYNSFVDGEGLAVEVGSTGQLDARENFWDTTDHDVIRTRIRDRNSTLSIAHFVPWDPILTSPHSDSPSSSSAFAGGR